MIRFFLLTVLLLSVFTGSAENYTEITTSGKYFFGEGSGATRDDADNAAMRDLLTQIKARVRVKDHVKNDRVEKNGKVISDNNTFSATIEVASEGTLEGTKVLPLESEPGSFKVLRYIEMGKLDQMYSARRKKIHGYINEAGKALSEGKIDVALRKYYWAYLLASSMRLAGNEEYNGHTLVTWLPGHIEEIMRDVKVSATSYGDGEVELHFSYKDKPVSSIDFTYEDHGIYSPICSAEDGNGRIEFDADSEPSAYKVLIEYRFEMKNRQDRDVASIMKEMGDEKVPMSHAFKVVDAPAKASLPVTIMTNERNAFDVAAALPVATENAPKSAFCDLDDANYRRPELMDASGITPYKAVMDTLLASIVSRRYDPPKSIFTAEGYSKFRRLLRYGQSKFIGSPELRFSETPDGVVVRGVQMSFSFTHGARKHFTENIVFTLNKKHRVSNVAFGLDKVTEDDILGRATFPVENRHRIVQFMENYKTAYALKDWDYIEKIFDDDALIIIGTVLKTTKRSEDNFYKQDEKIVYQRQSKSEFIQRLKSQNKEYINLSFSHAEVVRPAANEEVYGIQIEQDYYSNNYSDHGYLMLAINYNDPDRPLIFVRTWQPKPDPEFGTYSIQQFPFQAMKKAGI